MNNAAKFDVLVVYTDSIATSASSKKRNIDFPFMEPSRSQYNLAYAYFLKMCHKNGLRAAFTTTKDLTGDRTFKSYWIFEDKKWKKVLNMCFAPIIFDKFSPINQKQKENRQVLFSDSTIQPFNSSELLPLFFDKQKTFDVLSEFTVPTVIIKTGSKKSINNAHQKLVEILAAHPNEYDFSNEVVIKDRYGSGGNNIHRVTMKNMTDKIARIMYQNKYTSFILQPFTLFDEGYDNRGVMGFADIRVIYMGQKIIQAYIRTPKLNDFRCNEHQGGTVEYISTKDIPRNVSRVSKEIVDRLSYDGSLFALDYVISNSGNVYLMEGNSGPGIYWGLTNKMDRINTKKLIRSIVKEIVLRTNNISKISVKYPALPKIIHVGRFVEHYKKPSPLESLFIQ